MGSTARWRYSLVFYESKSRSFDIDKLYIARYNYDSKGNKIKVLTDEEYYAEKQAYTDKLRKEHSDWDDETIVKKVYDKYGSSNTIVIISCYI